MSDFQGFVTGFVTGFRPISAQRVTPLSACVPKRNCLSVTGVTGVTGISNRRMQPETGRGDSYSPAVTGRLPLLGKDATACNGVTALRWISGAIAAGRRTKRGRSASHMIGKREPHPQFLNETAHKSRISGQFGRHLVGTADFWHVLPSRKAECRQPLDPACRALVVARGAFIPLGLADATSASTPAHHAAGLRGAP